MNKLTNIGLEKKDSAEIADKLNEKHPQKHDFYPIVMSLLQTVDTTVDNIH